VLFYERRSLGFRQRRTIIGRNEQNLVPDAQALDQFGNENFRSAVLVNGIFKTKGNFHRIRK
jgi:hypothetical protein